MKEISTDSFVDITDVDCPITFIKVQVAIKKIEEGQTLEIRMNFGAAQRTCASYSSM